MEEKDISTVIQRQKEFYNKKYSEWPQLRCVNLLWKHLGDKIIEKLNITNDKCYLYLGVGDGFLMEYIAKKTRSQIYGIDVSDFSIFTCNAKRSKTCFYLLADAQNLPFKDHSFDGIIAPAVLHHLPQVRKALSEFTRVLRGDKLIFSTDPRDYFLRRSFNFFIKRIVSEDETQFKKIELEGLYQSSGFKIVSNSPIYLFAHIIIPLFRRIKIDLPEWLFNLLIWTDTSLAKRSFFKSLSWEVTIVASL